MMEETRKIDIGEVLEALLEKDRKIRKLEEEIRRLTAPEKKFYLDDSNPYTKEGVRSEQS